jgi:hypothetical protein
VVLPEPPPSGPRLPDEERAAPPSIPEAGPEEPAWEDPDAVTALDVDDPELIRWASDEVRRFEGRTARPAPAPVPPDAYLGTGAHGHASLPDESERDALRLLAELGGGALGVAVGGGLGALLVWGALESGANPDWLLVAVAAGGTLGAFGVTGGVVLAAEATGGEGKFGHAFIGQLVGSVAALPIVVLGLNEDMPAISIVAGAVLPLAGAILGYELSHASRGSGAPAVVFVTPIPEGALASLGGTIW